MESSSLFINLLLFARKYSNETKRLRFKNINEEETGLIVRVSAMNTSIRSLKFSAQNLDVNIL